MNSIRSNTLAATLAALLASGAAWAGDDKKAHDHSNPAVAPTTAQSATSIETGEKLNDGMEETAAAGEERITDAKFFERAASANMAEVELGRLAAERGTTPEVKAFAAMMQRDHSKKVEELTALATTKGVALPSELSPLHLDLKQKLAALSGAEFDEAYADAMVDAHVSMSDLLEKTAAQTEDADIRAFATETRKGVLAHLEHARKLDAENVALGDGDLDDDGEVDDE